MSTYTLDFSLTTEEDRCTLISSICSQTSFTPTQYTQMADYILLANHKENNTYPEIFTSPKTVHPVSSLDELLEKAEEIGNIDALEASFTQIQRNPYIKLKRKMDRSNPLYASIPNMQELWKTIDGVKEKLESKTIVIHAKAGKEGKLFGSITAKEIANEIKQRYGITVDKRKISITGEIKQYGTYDSEVKLYNGITAKIFVQVCE